MLAEVVHQFDANRLAINIREALFVEGVYPDHKYWPVIAIDCAQGSFWLKTDQPRPRQYRREAAENFGALTADVMSFAVSDRFDLEDPAITEGNRRNNFGGAGRKC